MRVRRRFSSSSALNSTLTGAAFFVFFFFGVETPICRCRKTSARGLARRLVKQVSYACTFLVSHIHLFICMHTSYGTRNKQKLSSTYVQCHPGQQISREFEYAHQTSASVDGQATTALARSSTRSHRGGRRARWSISASRHSCSQSLSSTRNRPIACFVLFDAPRRSKDVEERKEGRKEGRKGRMTEEGKKERKKERKVVSISCHMFGEKQYIQS